MTGMRTAQTRGGKKFWRGWSESTKGCDGCVLATHCCCCCCCQKRGPFQGAIIYHEQGPEGVVEEDDRGGHEHGDAHEFVKLRTWEKGVVSAHASIV